MPTMAFAPRSAAWASMRAKASSRVFSHSPVKSVMSPPTSVCSVPPSVPNKLRERTTMPRTTPRFRTIRWPGNSRAVVTRFGSIGVVMGIVPSRLRFYSSRLDLDVSVFEGNVALDRGHQLRELGEGQRLRAVRPCLLGDRMHLDQDAVGPGRHGRFGHRDDERALAGRMG